MPNFALGFEALWELGRALGIPDGLAVRSLALVVEADAVVVAKVEFIPGPDEVAAVTAWLEANRDRILVAPTVTERVTKVPPARGSRIAWFRKEVSP
jgi:hypothetical protein